MHYKTTTAILAYACVAMAATLPSGLVLRTEEELSVLSQPVSQMEWTGVVVDGAEPVTLYGPVESIIEQALKINPDFQLQEVDESDELEIRSLEERNRGDIICNIGGDKAGKATVTGTMNQHRYLKGLSGNCGVNARSCVRVACSYTDAVWLCNDNNRRITPSCSYLAGYVSNIMNKCQHTQQLGCRVCQIGAWSHLVNGQQFDTDNYNVIVSRDNKC